MRNTVLVIISTILGVLTLMIVMTIYGRMNRSMELKSSLSSAVEETVENMTVHLKYSIHNTDEFLADFAEALSLSLDSQSDVAVDVLQCDREKGILSVRVTLLYRHPNGEPGTAECERTVILNRLTVEEPQTFAVTFLVGAETYKSYLVWEGDMIGAPSAPDGIGGTFYGWRDGAGQAADFTQPVRGDLTFYADIR